ncbi:MAG: RecX family transcriptional regulator [Bacteroidota bacterium]|nr:RecX family transcriptional regulator [Bacteroidota bacterium]MDP4233993.1 RecX family transcriptional regulator [Bacteroidota bacterium]MDP4242860.1 RecX family transcriptional regulator [Bacteroidota bacterium]MDP4287702.1 RecX family transcriptional regulator [Bacteroidota bacterium]
MEGKITSIQRQKNDSARASIFLDEAFAFGVCDQTVEEFRLRKGDYIDRELFEKISEFDYFISAKRIAIAYLNYRARSEKEIRDRLSKEDIPTAITDRVLDFLREQHLVNDEHWSRAFVNDKLVRKPVSSRQLAFGLAQKGVGKEVIAETLAELNARESDEDRAQQAAEKRWPRILKAEADPRKRKQKLYTFLAGRGFSFETIETVYAKIRGDEVDRTGEGDD